MRGGMCGWCRPDGTSIRFNEIRPSYNADAGL